MATLLSQFFGHNKGRTMPVVLTREKMQAVANQTIPQGENKKRTFKAPWANSVAPMRLTFEGKHQGLYRYTTTKGEHAFTCKINGNLCLVLPRVNSLYLTEKMVAVEETQVFWQVTTLDRKASEKMKQCGGPRQYAGQLLRTGFKFDPSNWATLPADYEATITMGGKKEIFNVSNDKDELLDFLSIENRKDLISISKVSIGSAPTF